MGSLSIAPAQTPSFRDPSHTKLQLSPGKTAGTYAFSFTGTVAFTQEPAFPVNVSLTSFGRKPILQMPVLNSHPFTISRDLPPGSYGIESSVSSEKDSIYWSPELFDVFIDPAGLETVKSDSTVLLHQKKLTVLSPDPRGQRTIAEKRPMLRWKPLPGAVEYQVHWLEENGPSSFSAQGEGKTSGTQFRLTEDATPNRSYQWSVDAQGPQGEILGYGSGAYFYALGNKKAFAGVSKWTRPPKGASYFGVVPSKPLQNAPVGKGIFIQDVAADSPALKAGLQPEDLLTSFNGKTLDNVSVPQFVDMIRAEPIGTKVPVEFLRQGQKGSATITLAPMP